jgi:hypothetical protein
VGVRTHLRDGFFRFLRHVASIDETRQIFSDLLQLQNAMLPPRELSALHTAIPPYPELARAREGRRAGGRSEVVFVTGRFRSGSTLLWNLFRQVPTVTAYYEPFNERRWFDRSARGSHVDPTHLQITDYWSEYDGLEELGQYFSEQWKFAHLYMPEHAWNPAMQRYVEVLIERARGRPVLQFNEVDMRLPWLRAKFPEARILHIFRHPRDQWCSTLGAAASRAASCTVGDFEPYDGFYLLRWGRDLRHYFPFLTLDADAPAYELFYQLWKLSYLFGHLYADVSIAFEEIVGNPRASILKMFSALAVQGYDLEALVPLVSPVPLGKWRQHADHEWFSSVEARVDATFERFASGLIRHESGARPRIALPLEPTLPKVVGHG